MKRGDILQLDIEKTVPGGAGLARAEDGRVVFVRLGLPGSRVEAQVGMVKKSFAEARRLRVITPSPVMIAPRCPHVGTCGGCSFQELPYAEELRMKEDFVREALDGIAKITTELRPILPSPDEWHYRNKVEFSFGVDASSAPTIGYKLPGMYNHVFTVDTCPIFDPRVDALLAATRAWMPSAGVPIYIDERRGGVLQYLVLRRSIATGELLAHLVLRANAPDEQLWAVANDFMTRVLDVVPDAPAHVVATINRTGITPQVGSRETRVLRGTGELSEMLGGLTFRISPFSFFQTNSRGAEQLVQLIREAARLTGGEKVLDLYGGTGTIGQILARDARDVIGIELVADAVDDANANASRNGLSTYHSLAGDVHKIIAKQPEIVVGTDVVVVDPPRSGLDPKALLDVLAIRPKRIVSVSCNPATHARDLALLAEHYTVDWVRPVDMFPHTPHCESVAQLTFRDATRTMPPLATRPTGKA